MSQPHQGYNQMLPDELQMTSQLAQFRNGYADLYKGGGYGYHSDGQNQLDNDCHFDSELEFYQQQQQQWRDQDIDNASAVVAATACPPAECENEGQRFSLNNKQDLARRMLQDFEQKAFCNPKKKLDCERNINPVPVWQKQDKGTKDLNKAKVQQVLYCSDLMENDEAICQRCQVQHNFFFEPTQIARRLYAKYASSQNCYYSRDVNDILIGGRTQVVIEFKDAAAIDEQAEYLKRYYFMEEFHKKIKLFTEYYKFHKDIPRLFMLPETIVLNNYLDKKRLIDYYRIAQLIEEENKLNPQRPPKGIVGEKPPVRTNETEANVTQDSENHHQKGDIVGNNGEKDQEVYLEEISSFINRGIERNQGFYDQKLNQNETTLLEELNGKLKEIVNGCSRSYSLLESSVMGKGGDEGLKPFDNGQLDNFLSFINQQNLRKTNSQNGMPTAAARMENWLPGSVDVTRSKYSISQPVLVENKAQNQQQQQVLKEQDQKLANDCKQLKQTGDQNNFDNKSSQIVSGPIKKRVPPQLRLDDIDFNAEFALKNQNLAISNGVPYGLSSLTSKSIHTFSLQAQKDLLSVHSARDQYQLKGMSLQPNLPAKTSFKGEIVDVKSSALMQGQAIFSSCPPSKQANPQKYSLQQQQQAINQGSSSSIVVKMDTKESQLFTPRSPSFPASSHSIFQKNLLASNKPQQIASNKTPQTAVIPSTKPPFSPRDSLLPSPKQASIQGNQGYQNSIGSEKQLETSNIRQTINRINSPSKHEATTTPQVSENPTGNDSNLLAAMAKSKSGWRQLNLKLKLDHLNSSKEKPIQNSNNNNNTNVYGPLKGLISTVNANINSSNNGGSKDPNSQRSCSNKNIDQQTPKYNFYETFKQQIITHTSNPIASIIQKSAATPSNTQSQQNPPSNTASSNMLQLISAQQAFQKVIQQSNVVVNAKQQPEVLNKVAVASQGSSKQTTNSQTNNNPPTSSHQKTFSQPKLTVCVMPSQQKQQKEPEHQSPSALFQKNADPKINPLSSTQRRNPSATYIQTGSSQGTNNPTASKINPLEQQKKILSQQQQQHQTPGSRTESNAFINSQTKLVLEKSPSAPKESVTNNNQGINRTAITSVATGAIVVAQSKQPSRNPSLETSGNANVLSKKTSQLFQYPKKEIKSVYNLVQQLASDGLPAKSQQQYTSARNHNQTTSLCPPTSQFEFTGNQLSPSTFGSTLSPGTTTTTITNSGSIGLSSYQQSKASHQSSECDNKDSAPSTAGGAGGKSNNSSTQHHSSCGTMSATNIKSHSTSNASTFSTFSASTTNNNNNTTIASFSHNVQNTGSCSQNATKSLATNLKSPSSQAANFQKQPQYQETSQQLMKEGSSPQVSKQIQINHKHAKSENNANLLEAATHRSGCINHQFSMPISPPSISSMLSSVNNKNKQNSQVFQSNQISAQPSQQQQPLFSSPKKNIITTMAPNFTSSQIPVQKYASNASIFSSAVLHTQPMSPRLNINPSVIQGKKSDRQILANQQQIQYFPKNPCILSPSSAAHTKETPKSINHLQVQILPNSSIQATVLSPTNNNGSSDRFSISGVQKNTLIANQITTQNNQSKQQYSVSSCNNLSSHGLLKVQVEVGQKTKKKSMYQ